MIIIACFYPLKGIRLGDSVQIVNPRKSLDTTFCKTSYFNTETGEVSEWFDVPCGKCLGCRLDYSKTWAERIMLECESWKHNFFLTLTYDDDHLIFDKSEHNPTLVKGHFQSFMKALRQYLDRKGLDSCRFYGCGEYGDESMRPHYHIIVFNLPIDDLVYYGDSKMGYPLYMSERLTKLWNRGNVYIAEVSVQSAAYVARYTQKKAENGINKDFYKNLGIADEFVLMSRRPGIGAYYFFDNAEELLRTDKIYLPGGKVSKVPKYFLGLAEKTMDFDDSLLKSRRKVKAEALAAVKKKMYSVDEWSRAATEEKILKKNAKMLKRSSF